MRTPFATLICLTAPFLAAPVMATLASPVAAAELKTDHPGVVALGENNGKRAYTSFPDLMTLYVYDGDQRGKSSCDKLCTAVWNILRAADNAEPKGDWTVVQRDDGRKQWAYKGKPVYTFYDDRAYDAKGEGLPFGWWLNEAGIDAPAADAYLKYKTKTPAPGPLWRVLEP